MTLQAIKWKDGKLEVLDQVLLPAVSKYIVVKGVEDGWKVINKMQVRGAPAIAIVGCLSLSTEVRNEDFIDKKSLRQEVEGKLNYLASARPTAVNIKIAAEELIGLINKLTEDDTVTVQQMKEQCVDCFIKYFQRLRNDPYSMCKESKILSAEHVYCTETRPYNQGARLTAYELVNDKIPGTLICDNMVAALMKSRNITAVVVGADRVAANGDTANKIGTYQISIIAKYHNVPFYVAAPRTSIDFAIPSGDHIVIEERPEREMTHINDQRIAASGIQCWNPAFDITPASLITGIITEVGVYKPENLIKLFLQ
uniref:methylthioribose-1-phosphate isomerase isoform X2 n=1 Tax=Vespula vulgaris TaxID=7454 RepID=UPI00223BAC46|nr:methylthioribose-1-phosphate isomerase isoform X2 [Vespula vulgaris]